MDYWYLFGDSGVSVFPDSMVENDINSGGNYFNREVYKEGDEEMRDEFPSFFYLTNFALCGIM